jgi:hypothetical protein
MAFTVETGAGVSGANSYITVLQFQDHHGDRGTDVSGYTSTQIEQAAVRATDYIDKRFGAKFRGYKESKSQGLEWPRLSAFDNDDFLLDDVPDQLTKAACEYTLIALQLGPLLPLPARPFSTIDPATGEVVDGASGQVLKKEEEVGPLRTSVEYADTSNLLTRKKPGGSSSTLTTDFNLPEYPVADEWLQELIKVGFAVSLYRGN